MTLNTVLTTLKKNLKKELPFKDIEKEGLDENLKNFIIREQKKPNYSPRICAVMIALFERDGEVYFPCFIRPIKNRVHPGQIAFPGGGREEQDNDLNDTAIRETWEEIGVSISTVNIIGELTEMYVPPSNSLITPKVSFITESPVYNIDPNEVDKVLEIPLSVLLNEANHILKPIKIREMTIQMPAIQFEENVIWGATARILKEFTLLLK
ncbi:MAG: CoA pyrophosphatase [Saprospiraceae bacterium]